MKKTASNKSSNNESVRRPKSSETSVEVGLLLANCEHKYLMFYLLLLSLQVEKQMGERMLKCFTI
jgi:hypothetical protein